MDDSRLARLVAGTPGRGGIAGAVLHVSSGDGRTTLLGYSGRFARPTAENAS